MKFFKQILIFFALVYAQNNNDQYFIHGLDTKSNKNFELLLDSLSKSEANLKQNNTTCRMGIYLKGKRSQAEIIRVIMKNNPSLYNSSKHWMKTHSMNLNGIISLKIKILSSGLISEIATEKTTLNNPVFEEYIQKAIEKWQFSNISETNDTTEIIYPFIFSCKEN